MENKRITILNSPVDVLTMDETLARVEQAILQRSPLQHVVVNAAKLVNMRKDEKLRQSVVSSDVINADGQSVVWASRFLRKPLPERVAGIDLMQRIVELSARNNYRIFFFGAKEEVVSKVAEMYSQQYSSGIIAGYRNGYFSKDEEPAIAQQIADSKADVLFVAISSPKKEIFLNTYRELLQIPFVMGVGGSFDVVAGLTKRAPQWMQNTGLEWFYRFLQEPRRLWKRYLVTNSLFLYYVLKEKMRSRRQTSTHLKKSDD